MVGKATRTAIDRILSAILICLSVIIYAVFSQGSRLAAEDHVQHLSVHEDRVLIPSFMGFGVEIDPYFYTPTPEQWIRITSRLDILHPAFFRVMIGGAIYCRKLDSKGCSNYVWQGSDTEIPERFRQMLRILDYAEMHNIPVMFGEFHWPNLPHDRSVAPINGPDDPRWAEIIAPLLKYLVNDKHYTVLRFYNYMNEPNGSWSWPGGRDSINYDAWRKGILHTRQVFDREGLQAISIVGPDNSGDWSWLDRTARGTAAVLGGWEMHFYPKDKDITAGEVFRILDSERQILLKEDLHAQSKPRFLGECGLVTGKINGSQPRVRTQLYGVLMADLAVQVAQAGWMGASAWDLDDAMYPMKGRANGFGVWGFWNTEGGRAGYPEEERVRPWFRPWALLTHLFPVGSQILQVSDPSDSSGVRAVAAKDMRDSSAKWGIALVNDHDRATGINFELPKGSASEKWRIYKYFPGVTQKDYADLKENSETLKVQSGHVNISLPGQSVAFVVNGDGLR